MPTFGSLFAGIGGIDLGLERAGWTGRWQVEWDDYCQHVLAHHWPDIPRYGDITTVDWTRVEPVDLLAGGFPCQPVSSAGRQKAQGDERWLWPEFFRAVRELRPELVLVENVTNLLAVNGGSAFGEVLGDLATIGYDAEWDCIPASAIGALHERDRVWLVAYSQRTGSQGRAGRGEHGEGRTSGVAASGREALADSLGRRSSGPRQPVFAFHPAAGSDRQAAHALDGRVAHEWLTEPDVGRVAHGVPARVDRLRALGNAVVPQVVEVIGRRLLEVIA